MDDYTESKKRVRDELDGSLVDLPESKRTRVDSSGLKMIKPCAKEDSNVNSSESEQIGSHTKHATIDLLGTEEMQDELLNILEDSEAVAERDETIQGLELDSFIKSFEEEIQTQPPSKMSSGHNESQPELGYLFEASDDELGLPPTGGFNTESKLEAIDFTTSSSGNFELDGNLGFEDEIPCYDLFEIGVGIDSGGMGTGEENAWGGEFVALGGLFDYSDVPFRPESLPA